MLTAGVRTSQTHSKRKWNGENPKQEVIPRMFLIIGIQRAQDYTQENEQINRLVHSNQAN